MIGSFSRVTGVCLVAALAVLCVPGSAYGDTVSELKKAARKTPRDPAKALELGQKLRRAGLFTLSARVLQRAYLRRGQGAHAAQLRYSRARTLIAARKQKAAMRECRALKKISFVKGQACIAEAQLLWRRASVAEPEAKKALNRDPRDYDALVAHGRALRQIGKPKLAEAALRKAVSVDASRFEAHYYLGLLLLATNRTSDGVASLRKAHRAASDHPGVALRLARALPAGTEATQLLESAVAVRPGFGLAHAELGKVLLAQGKLAAAEKALRKAISVNAKEADWHARLGEVHNANGKHAEALKAAAAALKLVGNHAAAKLVEADALAGKGDIDLAIEAYERAHGLARSDPAPLVHAAYASLKGGRPTTARAFADRAVQEFADWGPAWVALGDVHAKAREKKSARAAYKKALKKKGPVDAAEVRRKIAALK